MSSVTSISSVSNTVRSRVTPEEWDVRVKLAAAYRLAALYKWIAIVVVVSIISWAFLLKPSIKARFN